VEKYRNPRATEGESIFIRDFEAKFEFFSAFEI
jgi:hypothetical protein